MPQNPRPHDRRRGATMILYTMLLSLVILPLVGLAIDVTRMYLVQGRLQTAADAAALGATRLLSTSANTTEIAGEFLKANYARSFWSSSVPTVNTVTVSTTTNLNPNRSTVTVKANLTVPMIFLGFMFHGSAGGSMTMSATGSHNVYSLSGCTLAYPTGSAPALSSVVFNESTVLANYGPTFVYPHGKIMAWYGDEHALTLGVREVQIVTVTTTSGTASGSASASGSTTGSTTTTTTTVTSTTDYTIAQYNSTTKNAVSYSGSLAVGTTALTGEQAGTDTALWNATYGYIDNGRPLWPALYITDITTAPTATSGDWQQGGTAAIPPTAVYGTWNSAVRTVDESTSPYTITVTPDADPTSNTWAGVPDTPPGGFPTNEGYGAEVVWNIDSLGLRPGRMYRLQFMIHDGDQNNSGGDVGEGCAIAIY